MGTHTLTKYPLHLNHSLSSFLNNMYALSIKRNSDLMKKMHEQHVFLSNVDETLFIISVVMHTMGMPDYWLVEDENMSSTLG